MTQADDLEVTDSLARHLYETMEEIERVEPFGPAWAVMPEAYKHWYRQCVTAFLARKDVLAAAKALEVSL